MLKRDISDSDYIANSLLNCYFSDSRFLKNELLDSKLELIDHPEIFLTANLKTKSR